MHGHSDLLFRSFEQSGHDARDAPPVVRFPGELAAARFRNLGELCFPVVFRHAPFRLDPALLLQPYQHGIDRSLIQEEHVLADLLDAQRNAPAMQMAHDGQRLENHQIERALQNFDSLSDMMRSC
jgi:hypothetical protein